MHVQPLPPEIAADDQRPSPGQSGFSVVEVLIAAAILLVVTMGILPLFTRSITNNLQGQKLTEAVHRAKSEMEELIQVDFANVEMTIPSGQTELVTTQYWSRTKKEWVPTVNDLHALDPGVEFVRTTTVRQYNMGSLTDSANTADWVALDGDTPAPQVHLKEIEVVVSTSNTIDGPSSNMEGMARQLSLRTFKAF